MPIGPDWRYALRHAQHGVLQPDHRAPGTRVSGSLRGLPDRFVGDRQLTGRLNLLVLLLLLTGCTTAGGAPQTSATPTSPAPALRPPPTPTSAARSGIVVIESADQFFYPAEVTVPPGTTVVWKDVQGTHNMVADDQSFASNVLIEGESYAHLFSVSGHYRYICTLHVGAGMWAEIDVE